MSGAYRRSLEWVPIVKFRGIICIPCYISVKNFASDITPASSQGIERVEGYKRAKRRTGEGGE